MNVDKTEKTKKVPYRIRYILVALLAIVLMLTASVLTMEKPPKTSSNQTIDSTNLVNMNQHLTITSERIFSWRIPTATPTPTPKATTTPKPTPTQTSTTRPTSTPIPSTQPTPTTNPSQSNSARQFQIGVNLLSTYHEYVPKYTTDTILNRDFAKFQKDGITVISLSLYWYRIEGNIKGSYDGKLPDGSIYGDTFLANIKHVIAVANQYGIKVLVTFHTLWGDESTWCTPDYVIDPVTGKNVGLAIVRSPEMRQAYINMVKHTTSYLAGTPGIWAWAVLNEPWYWGRVSNEHDFVTSNGKTQRDNFLILFQDLSNTVKSNDGRPVTIRFCNAKEYKGSDGTPYVKNIFTDDWNMDSRLFNALDFVSFNVYPPNYSKNEANWQSITKTNIVDSSQRKQVWITEFGDKSSNEIDQANAYASLISFFKTLPVTGIIAWQWTSGSVSDANSQSTWNLCSNSNTGKVKPAYNALVAP